MKPYALTVSDQELIIAFIKRDSEDYSNIDRTRYTQIVSNQIIGTIITHGNEVVMLQLYAHGNAGSVTRTLEIDLNGSEAWNDETTRNTNFIINLCTCGSENHAFTTAIKN